MQNNKIITTNGFKCGINNSFAKINVEELINRYRDTEKFIDYCKKCNRYNACWACPPFDFNADEYLMQYKTAFIVGTKITLDEKNISQQEKNQTTQISNEIIKEVRIRLDYTLLNMENQQPQSKAFFAGTCYICSTVECAKINGNLCVSPEKVRPSLEAFGFDVCNISKELLNIDIQWANDDVLPEYFTLVSGFFTVDENCVF